MKNAMIVLLILYAAIGQGCTNGDLVVVSQSEKDAIDKIRSGTYELIAKDDLIKLRNVGRYQRYDTGSKTWRLDTSTGQTCLLLTTKADWETADAKAAACAP